LLLTTSWEYYQRTGQTAVLERLHRAVKTERGWSDCYGYVLVATGRAEVMIEPVMSIWDGAPFLPILEEAGGTFTDWAGVVRIDGGNAIATNGKALGEMLQVVREAMFI
jgi:fructose-1,6-bisphosphatase/inositol monophosphatase family enzyme